MDPWSVSPYPSLHIDSHSLSNCVHKPEAHGNTAKSTVFLFSVSGILSLQIKFTKEHEEDHMARTFISQNQIT